MLERGPGSLEAGRQLPDSIGGNESGEKIVGAARVAGASICINYMDRKNLSVRDELEPRAHRYGPAVLGLC